MKIKKITSVFLVFVMLLGLFTQVSLPVNATNSTVRDTVLILDDSGSMDGEPMDKLIQSADKFCQSVLAASGTNRVAVVTYSTQAELKSGFTNDYSVLQVAINSMRESGTTNIYDALVIANDLLSQSSANVKNIVLMSDGLPNRGATVDVGQYSYDDYSGYEYANAVYNQAVSYHPNYYIYTLGFFHNIYGDTKAFAGRFMSDLQNAGYYEVDKVEDLEFTFGELAEAITETKVTGTFKYPSGAKDYSATYYYSDQYFYNTSMEYNPSLATMSLCLAMSAFGSGETSSYENKSVNVKNLMEDLMFDPDAFETTKSFNEKPTTDSIAAAIGQKKIKDTNGDVYTLIAVAVRGGGYEQEWASNFTIGAQNNHDGFTNASNQIVDFIKSYVANHGVEGNVKLWITGYSRAAATANLTAACFDKGETLGDNVTLAQKDLFAYCFETPAGTVDKDANDLSKYGNIFNIINPNDLVTKVAPKAMGFGRYGYDKVLPTAENKYNSYSRITENMKNHYEVLESTGEYVLDKFSYKGVDLTRIIPGGKEVVYDSEEQMSMSAFLDEFLSGLVNKYVSRDVFNTQLESGIRELCKALFEDESKAKDVLSATVEKIKGNLSGLLWSLSWNERGAYKKVAGYLTDSLKEAGITNFDEEEIKKAAQPLIDALLAYAANNWSHTATIVENKDYFFPAHYPELCLAWMQSMDVNYTTDASEDFSSGSYRIIRINCPVDVNVYDMQGTLVASIIKDKAQKIDGSSINSLVNDNDEKVIYLPADAEFRIEMIGTDTGLVNYTVNEFSHEAGQVNRVTSYYDVPIEKDRTLNAVVPAYDSTYLTNGTANGTDTKYQLTDMDGNELPPDLDAAGTAATSLLYEVTAVSENTEHGVVTGSGLKQVGSFTKVFAIAKEGCTFEGWYVNERKVSEDTEYRFCVKGDIALLAKFGDGTPVSTDDVEKNDDNNTWIIVVVILLVLLITGGAIVLLVYSGKKKEPKGEFDIPILEHEEKFIDPEEESITEDTQTISGIIQITNGSMNGFSVPIKDGETLYLGKDPKISNLVFSNDYAKVSRVHCSVTFDARAGKYFVVDSSSNGTYLVNRVRLEKGKRTPLNMNTVIVLANDDCTVLLG